MRPTMTCAVLGIMLSLAALTALAAARSGDDPRAAVSRLLDELHDAASQADGARYFALFAPDAVFLGTDATERWPIAEFRTYAQARFDAGTGWTYHLIKDKRFITIGEDGLTAWFDELLTNARYDTCRGSGVLRRTGDAWRIAQYNLALTIPNDVASDVVALIKANEK